MRIGISDILPTGTNTYTLLDGTNVNGANISQLGVKRVAVTIYHDQAGTLRASIRMRSGNWRVYYNEVKSASTATALTGPVDFLIDMSESWKLEWVNGGVDQTVFEVEMTGLESRLVGN